MVASTQLPSLETSPPAAHGSPQGAHLVPRTASLLRTDPVAVPRLDVGDRIPPLGGRTFLWIPTPGPLEAVLVGRVALRGSRPVVRGSPLRAIASTVADRVPRRQQDNDHRGGAQAKYRHRGAQRCEGGRGGDHGGMGPRDTPRDGPQEGAVPDEEQRHAPEDQRDRGGRSGVGWVGQDQLVGGCYRDYSPPA